jgi:hypothetical protein
MTIPSRGIEKSKQRNVATTTSPRRSSLAWESHRFFVFGFPFLVCTTYLSMASVDTHAHPHALRFDPQIIR